MKKIYFAAVLVLLNIAAFSQEVPVGYLMHQEEINSLETLELPSFNQEELVAEAEADDKLGKMSMYGRLIDYTASPETQGRWTVDEQGNSVWQLRFRTSGALATGIIFSNFYLPEGASYYIYSADRSWFEGPFFSEENHSSGIYRTADAYGDEAIFEYVQPSTVVGQPKLEIKNFINYYRFIYDPREDRGGLNTSEACQVDVNCPEGADWVDQRNAVVRLSLVAGNGIGFCTGTLVNNTSGDCKNYILTAMHCTIDSNSADLLASTVRFKFQKANCGSGSAPQSFQRVGLILRADSNDNGGSSGSDFALVEMDDTIPASWDAYYAGWSAVTSAPAVFGSNYRAVCIHHPSGDAKKISYASTCTNGTYPGGSAGNHWRVIWTETQTNWGVTEGGSSGSPIFNGNKRIIGTLTGGLSFCDAQTSPDYYGKMDKHFYGNPNPANEDLVDWLDPTSTGIVSFDGAYPNTANAQPCAPSTGTSVNELNFENFVIFPTVASDFIQLQTPSGVAIKEVRIFDSNGGLIKSFNMISSGMKLPLFNFSQGVYLISAIQENGNFVTKKFTVVK